MIKLYRFARADVRRTVLLGSVRRPWAEWVRRGLAKELYGHGLGRHTAEQIYALNQCVAPTR